MTVQLIYWSLDTPFLVESSPTSLWENMREIASTCTIVLFPSARQGRFLIPYSIYPWHETARYSTRNHRRSKLPAYHWVISAVTKWPRRNRPLQIWGVQRPDFSCHDFSSYNRFDQTEDTIIPVPSLTRVDGQCLLTLVII